MSGLGGLRRIFKTQYQYLLSVCNKLNLFSQSFVYTKQLIFANTCLAPGISLKLDIIQIRFNPLDPLNPRSLTFFYFCQVSIYKKMIGSIKPPIISSYFTTVLLLIVFCINAKGSMRNSSQTFLGNEFTCFPANAVGFVLNTHQGSL